MSAQRCRKAVIIGHCSGKTTKIHAIVDGLGNPISFLLSGGQIHHSKMAIALLWTTNIRGNRVLADRAYGSDEIRSYIVQLVQHDDDYVIPPKQNTKHPWFVDWYLYKERHLIECFFNKLKQLRRVATKYDKLTSSFLTFIYVAAIAILLK